MSEEKIIGIFYLSKAGNDFQTDELAELIERAKLVNKELDITGFLYYQDQHFIQFIEGPELQVYSLMQRISNDKRHQVLFKLEREQDKRFSEFWNMRWIETPTSMEPILLDYSRCAIQLDDQVSEERTRHIWKLHSQICDEFRLRESKDHGIRHSLNLLDISISLQEVGVYEWDLIEDRVTHFNEYWQKTLELDVEDVSSQLFSRVYAEDREKTFKLLEERLVESDTSKHVFRIWDKSFEELLWVHNTSKVIERDTDGKPIKILGAFQNISPLKESELRYRNLFVHMPIPFAHGRLIKNEKDEVVDWKYLQINPAMEDLLMLPKEEVVGKKMSDLHPELTLESAEWVQLLEAASFTGKKQNMEFFSETFQKHLRVHAFRPKEGEFAITIQDQTDRILASTRFDLTIQMEKIALWEWVIPEDRVANHNHYWEDLYEFENKNTSAQFYERIHPDDAQSSQDALMEHMEGKVNNFNQLYRLWKKDKSGYTWIKNTGTIIDKDANGAPTRIMGISRNVTDEKEAELKLIESKEQFENLFQNLNANFVVIKLVRDENGDPEDFIFTRINKHASEIMQVTEEEIIGTTLTEFFPDIKDRTGWFERLSHTALTKESQEFTKYAGGLKAHLAMTLFSPQEDHVAAVFSDVSRQVKASKALRVANTKLQLSLDMEELAFYEWNILDDRIENANEYWKSIYEFDEENATDQFNARIPKEKLDELWRESEEYWKKDDAFTQVYPIWDKTFSRLIWIRNTSAIIERTRDGAPARLLGVTKDITDELKAKKEIQDLLRKSEVANIYKNQFLSNMSHEIRTPLNGIVGFSDLLKEGDLTSEERTQFSNLIRQSTNRLLHLIDDILDISKMEAGELSLAIEPLEVSTRLKNLCIQFKELEIFQSKKEVELQLDMPDNVKGIVMNTDPTRLDQIISNLVFNSIKFTENGAITLGVRRLDNMKVLIYVQDEGIGIPQDKLVRIFNRFEQAHSSFKVKSEGTGLGLAIVRGLVSLLQGTIRVESEEGKGTRFDIELPLSMNSELQLKEEMEKEQSSEKESVETKGVSLLVAEDEETNILYYKTLFRKTDYTVFYARDGEESVKLYKEHPEIDVVLMDIRMPLMSGDEAARLILKMDPKAKIIAQTAFAMQNEKESLLSMGFKGYITKPILKGSLFDLIENTLKAD